MASAPGSTVVASNQAAMLLLAGVGVVLAAQLWPVVPITGAIALIAWGTCLAVRQRWDLLLLAAVVYAPLSVMAVTAQIDLALRSSVAWGLLAGADAALAIVLLASLARQTGEILAAGAER